MKALFLFAALSGMTSVILGAFGAHGLRGRLEERLMNAFETGVTYQMSHSLAILLVCVLIQLWGRNWALQYAGLAFTVGILMFSGSLYLLALTGMKWLGPVTPLGGVFFIVGWGLLAWGVWQGAGNAA
ncbi:MAG: DUF423 domain-containing protein [Pseudomonadales bacterium]|nr:DUF423 domain-containing protein [Pseudomonadales bacterium]